MRPAWARAAVAALACLCLPSSASASSVLVMSRDGHVRAVDDRFVPAGDDLQPPTTARRRTAPRRPRGRVASAAATRSALRSLLDAGAIDQATYDDATSTYAHALRLIGKARGARRAEIAGVVSDLDRMAAAGRVTVARLPALLETLKRNVEWWSDGPLLSPGRRVSFAGSRIVWQHYAGHGIQIQWLATWGKANSLSKDKLHDPEYREAIDEGLALAGQRAGGVAFEYLFPFDGGQPPWVSGLAQATAITALSRGAIRLEDSDYFVAARSALGIFKTPPPEGVAQPQASGTHYLQYSFTGLHVLNGFVQALNGLHDFAVYANDDEGRALFAGGESELRAELPAYDTGGWSRYSPGVDSPLSYHQLLADFLHRLCIRMRHTGEDGEVYCQDADRFTADLTTPPKLTLPAPIHRPRRRHLASLALSVDKPVRATVVIKRGSWTRRIALRLSSGGHGIAWRPPKAGAYAVHVTAVDPAGNRSAIDGTLQVRP